MIRGLGCLSYIGMLGVLFALVCYTAFSLFVRRGATPVPELVGLPENEARALLADQGLVGELSEDDRFDEDIPAEHVLIHRPRAGTLVKRGATVTLILSRGPQRIVVPAVIGEAPQAAQVTLAAAGLSVGRTISIYTDSGEPGSVIEQSPRPETLVEQNAPVDLFIALTNPQKTFVMPDVVQLDQDRVKRFFEQRGFRLGRVSYETYEGLPPGTVVRQFPLAGHPVRQGDTISLGVVAPEAATASQAEAPDQTMRTP